MEKNWRTMFLVMSITILATICSANRKQFTITPIGDNPGIYYEYLGNARLILSKWQITIVLDFKNTRRIPEAKEKQFTSIYEHCNLLFGKECYTLLNKRNVRENLNTLKNTLSDLLGYFQHSNDILSPSESNPLPHSVVKRNAPFEFIGWASKKLFGTMDATDREGLKEQIDQLFERQTNISMLEAEQTHIVRSNLEKFHHTIDRNQKEMDNLHAHLSLILNTTRRIENELEHTTAKEELIRWISEFEQSLILCINTYKTLTNAVKLTSQGHLHPSLLSHEQLQQILREIETMKHTQNTPWESSFITLESLFSVSETEISVNNGNLIVSIQFPLVSRATFQNFQIHPLPIITALSANHSRMIQIETSFKNLFISPNFHNYILAPDSFLNQCKKHNHTLLCQPTVPLRDYSEHAPCEFLMLHAPTNNNLKQCRFRILNKMENYWTKLTSTDEWLYSAQAPTTLTLHCNNSPITYVPLNQTGILTLHGNCTAYTNGFTLYGVNSIKTVKTFTYEPNLEPSIIFIPATQPILTDSLGTYTINHHEIEKEITNWADSEDCLTLNKVESRFREIAMQKQKRTWGTILTITNYGAPLCTVIILLLLQRFGTVKGTTPTSEHAYELNSYNRPELTELTRS